MPASPSAMAASAARPQVETALGRLAGVALSPSAIAESGASAPAAAAAGVHVFRGIPYALPPFDALRWHAPQPVPPWAGVRDASTFGPHAPQALRDLLAPGLEGGADCLTLNIWAPAEPTTAPRPVLVWLPGGGFMRGGTGDAIYDGTPFAQAGIVFVSLNYRLGTDGFMHFADAPDNRGLLDQLAALRWVQQHIGAFGGDPQRVTLAGVSAGAGSVAHFLALPEARGLFARAILQSPSVAYQTLDEADRVRHAVARLLDVAPTRAGIGAVPMQALVGVIARLTAKYELRREAGLSARNFFPLRPVLDGTLLRTDPLSALAQPAVPDEPARDVLVGANAEEMRFYLIPGREIDRVDETRLNAFVAATGLPPDAWAAYTTRTAGATPGERLCTLQSDYYYRTPARRIAATTTARGARAWLYEFAWQSALHQGQMGAAHAMELPYVFGRVHTARAQEFVGPGTSAPLAQHLHAAWCAFVRNGAPADWPAWTPEQRSRMTWQAAPDGRDHSHTGADPAAAEMAGWDYRSPAPVTTTPAATPTAPAR